MVYNGFKKKMVVYNGFLKKKKKGGVVGWCFGFFVVVLVYVWCGFGVF